MDFLSHFERYVIIYYYNVVGCSRSQRRKAHAELAYYWEAELSRVSKDLFFQLPFYKFLNSTLAFPILFYIFVC